MFKDYYKQELQQLRDLGKEFSQGNPVLAPLLSGPSNDPDVERRGVPDRVHVEEFGLRFAGDRGGSVQPRSEAARREQ